MGSYSMRRYDVQNEMDEIYIYIYIKYANRSYIQNIGPEFVSEDVI